MAIYQPDITFAAWRQTFQNKIQNIVLRSHLSLPESPESLEPNFVILGKTLFAQRNLHLEDSPFPLDIL